ncbi:tRNA lysidine(34) synthetase TilS [Ascidiaceihabitans sp.]|uniref:tRNA lysidine(34) synthetase TilS n=1 Tax=Ascidiaceihabitans sp. TaxID=1872644 RepID=UPI0032987F7F
MNKADLSDAFAQQLLPKPPSKLGVAVSGGGDSMALLSLAAIFAEEHGIELHVISIDHGLRADAYQELKLVTQMCADIGCQHHLEYWSGWDGGGNLQDRARVARYELMGDWAAGNGISVVLLGHTANDQAETLMMRLARGAGVDGLSAMSARRMQNGVTWVRPLLGITRRDLRSYLQSEGLAWAEDPSNEDRDYERIRMRDALRILEPLGFSTENLTAVADQMSQARAALNWQTFLAAREVVEVSHGAVCFNMKVYRTLPVEISRRLLVHALGWLSNAEYPPRRNAVEVARHSIRDGVGHTLHGCQIQREGNTLWIYREFNAIKDLTSDIGDAWDDRWYVEGEEEDPVYRVRALGADGLAQIKDWRELGVPRAALMVTPGVFLNGELIAAPAVEDTDEWSVELEGGANGFFGALLSH